MTEVIDRRDFLKVVALAGGGFALGFFENSALAAENGLFAPNPWVRLESSGLITILVDKSEMGQGVMTALPMLLAEELDADWSSIRVEFAPAAPEYAHPWFHTQATGGSTSIRAMWLPLRQAGATARQMLRQAAANAWGLSINDVNTHQGVLSAGLHRAHYGDMANAAAKLPVPKDVPLKDVKDFQIIGKTHPRVDSLDKAIGKAQYGLDMRMPGMLTAVVVRAPVVGAKRVKFNAAAALKIKGVRFVVPVDSPTSMGVAVLADNTWLAMKGCDLLEVEWDNGVNAFLSTPALKEKMTVLSLSGAGAITARQKSDPTSAAVVRTVRATYDVPYLAHAPMEPMNCTAWVRDDAVELWVGTQAQGPHQMIASKITGVPIEKVKVHTQFLGGGFGRRFAPDFVVEAVTLSKAVKLPVKVMYTRTDDLRAYYYRPMAVCSLEAGLDASGNVVSWKACTVADSIAEGTGFEPALIKEGVDQTSVEGLSDIPYAIPNFKVDWVKFQPGVRVWFWRSVGHTQNSFFSESFIDELAAAAGRDPFEYRRAMLGKAPRHRAVLELAAEKAGWGKPLPPGVARGIALVESFGSIVAEVAEVSLQDGQPKVHRVVIAADVGTVVNPDTVAAQLEGAMLYGLSAALRGQITFKEGVVQQSNFHDYPMVALDETPKVEVYTIASQESPGGVGEPGTPPIAPALCNAFFALTGQRVTRLPLSETRFSKT